MRIRTFRKEGKEFYSMERVTRYERASESVLDGWKEEKYVLFSDGRCVLYDTVSYIA